MYPPGQTFTFVDGQLGLPSAALAIPLVVGVTSAGTAATLYDFSDSQKLKTALGHGPAVETALQVMLQPGVGRVLVLKTAASTAGSNTSVTATLVGSATGTVTLAGAPFNSYDAIIEITKTGTVATGKFKYSLDGGLTYSEEITIPSGGTYAIPGTNITATFVPGAGTVFFEKGDLHTWTSTAPHYTTSDISAAVTALLAQIGTRDLARIFWAGENSSAANAATMFAAIDTHMATLESKFYFARAIMDGGNDTTENFLTSMGAVADVRVVPTYGRQAMTSLDPIAGYGTPTLPLLVSAARRGAGVDLSENLGRKRSGPLDGVVSITHDERTATAFTEADKVITARTYQGEAGFYLTNGYLKSPSGSDYLYFDWGLVVDEAARIVHAGQENWLLSKVRTTDTGGILDEDAARIEGEIQGNLNARIMQPINVEGRKGHATGVQYAIDREFDTFASRTISSAVRLQPLTPIEGFETVVGLVKSLAA